MSFSKLKAAAAVALMVAVSGCGSQSSDAQPSFSIPKPQSSATSSAAPSSEASVDSAPPTETSEPTQSTEPAASSPEQKSPVDGAYAGAGGAAPANATKITSIYKAEYGPDSALIQTPSGNIGCEINTEYSGCGVDSWATSDLYPDPMWGSLWWVEMSGGVEPKVAHRGDAPYYKYGTPKPQILQYGDVVYYANTVCASEQAGLTCWDVTTGHGALINKSGYKAF